MTDEQKRLEALKLYNKLVRTRRFMRHQAKMWGNSTAPRNVVAVLSTDRVIYAEQKAHRAGGEADVVVYWPEDDRITVAHISSGRHDSVMGVDPVDVHEDSTVAMLWSLIKASGPVYTTTRAEVMA